jgi:hypothetical protein
MHILTEILPFSYFFILFTKRKKSENWERNKKRGFICILHQIGTRLQLITPLDT